MSIFQQVIADWRERNAERIARYRDQAERFYHEAAAIYRRAGFELEAAECQKLSGQIYLARFGLELAR